jgi:hypothetical protein
VRPTKHLHVSADGGGVVRFSAGTSRAELTIDQDGLVRDYPTLGRRV